MECPKYMTNEKHFKFSSIRILSHKTELQPITVKELDCEKSPMLLKQAGTFQQVPDLHVSPNRRMENELERSKLPEIDVLKLPNVDHSSSSFYRKYLCRLFLN